MNIEIDTTGAHPVAKLSGQLMALDSESLVDALHECVAGERKNLIVDLSNLDSIDSSGLSSLINIATHARMGGGQVILVNPNSFVSGVLSVTKLDDWFEICGDLPAAFQSLGT